jgi:hypothetical protein
MKQSVKKGLVEVAVEQDKTHGKQAKVRVEAMCNP